MSILTDSFGAAGSTFATERAESAGMESEAACVAGSLQEKRKSVAITEQVRNVFMRWNFFTKVDKFIVDSR